MGLCPAQIASMAQSIGSRCAKAHSASYLGIILLAHHVWLQTADTSLARACDKCVLHGVCPTDSRLHCPVLARAARKALDACMSAASHKFYDNCQEPL